MSGAKGSLRNAVTELVRNLGQATTDDLMPHLRSYTREQVMQAMQNEKYAGFLVIVGRAPNNGKRGLSIYVATNETPTPKPKRNPVPRSITRKMGQIPSVWALGALYEGKTA